MTDPVQQMIVRMRLYGLHHWADLVEELVKQARERA